MRKRTVVAVAGFVLLTGCGAGVMAPIVGSLVLPTGRETATLRLDLTNPRKPRFSGTIAGRHFAGTYDTHGSVAAAATLCPMKGSSQAAYDFSGTIDGQPYSFIGCQVVSYSMAQGTTGIPTVGLSGPTGAPPASGTILPGKVTGIRLVFKIRGHVGRDALEGAATWSFSATSVLCQGEGACSVSMPITGMIGAHELSGTATIANLHNQGFGLITAVLTVS